MGNQNQPPSEFVSHTKRSGRIRDDDTVPIHPNGQIRISVTQADRLGLADVPAFDVGSIDGDLALRPVDEYDPDETYKLSTDRSGGRIITARGPLDDLGRVPPDESHDLEIEQRPDGIIIVDIDELPRRDADA